MPRDLKEVLKLAAKVEKSANEFASIRFNTLSFRKSDTKTLLRTLNHLTGANRIIVENIQYISEALTYFGSTHLFNREGRK